MGNFYGGAPGRDLTIAKSVTTEQELTNIMIDDSYPIGTLVFWVGANSTYEYGTVLSKAYNEWKNLGVKIAKGEDIEVFGVNTFPKNEDSNDINTDFKNYIIDISTPDNIKNYIMKQNSALIGTWNGSSYYITYDKANGEQTLSTLAGQSGTIFKFMPIGGTTASKTTIINYASLPQDLSNVIKTGSDNIQVEVFINHNKNNLKSELALYKGQAFISLLGSSLEYSEGNVNIDITVKITEDSHGFKVYLENPPFPLTHQIELKNGDTEFEIPYYCGGKFGNIPLDIYCLETNDQRLANVRKYIKKITSEQLQSSESKFKVIFDYDDALFPQGAEPYNFLIVDHA